MIKATDAARYLISLDTELQYFNKNLINDKFYEGNARLNKMLHLAQNIYIAIHGEKLIEEDFYAYENGGVVPCVQENFSFLLGTRKKEGCNIEDTEKKFLKKIFIMLKDAPIDELIDIDHEDPAWQEKNKYRKKSEQKIDSMKYMDDYKDRYEAAIFYMNKMVVE